MRADEVALGCRSGVVRSAPCAARVRRYQRSPRGFWRRMIEWRNPDSLPVRGTGRRPPASAQPAAQAGASSNRRWAIASSRAGALSPTAITATRAGAGAADTKVEPSSPFSTAS